MTGYLVLKKFDENLVWVFSQQKIAPPRFDRGTCGWLELILSETVYLYGPTTLPLSYGAEGES